jgi:hypothetical protein
MAILGRASFDMHSIRLGDPRTRIFRHRPPPPAPVVSEEERAVRLERWKAAWATRTKHEVHFFSCTFHDQKYTQARWSQKGQSYVAWSKLDWNDFADLTTFFSGPEPATRHSLIFGIGNLSTAHPG